MEKRDLVSISKVKGQFEKGNLSSCSREEFIVDYANKKYLPTNVRLRISHDDVIESRFYDDEVQKIERKEQ